jgi:aminopeptidase N
MRTSLLILLGALGAAAPGQDRPKPNVSGGPLRPDQACYDVRHYTLVIDVDPAERAIDAALTMRADAVQAIETFALDLDMHLQVGEVTVQGEPAPHQHADGRIVITPAQPIERGATFEVRVAYGGKPLVAKRPPWTGGFTWSETKAGKPWIATSCQGEGADLWWPCKDHPSDKPDGFDLHVTVPAGLICASNGTLQGEPKTAAGKTTFHWRSASPIANYNIALNIAPYVVLEDTFTCVDGTEMPIAFYVLPSSKRKAKRCMPAFLDHIAVFERLLGPYPFRHEKYGIAETPHLGMEHQTMVAYGNGFREEQYDWLHNHELAHEWWGNLVTCRDWKDMWLHEGFGTYMQPLYREVRFGRKAYDDEIHRHRTMNRSPIAPRKVQDSKQIYFGGGGGNDIYYKGSLVLHSLRYHLGDAKFFEALKRFAYPTEASRQRTDGSQVRFVDTEDFVQLVDEIAGVDTRWFFEVYVRSAGLPRVVYRFEDGTLHLEWRTPGDLPFPMDVPISVSGAEVRVAMVDGKGAMKIGDAEFKIDPNRRLLMASPRRLQ